MLRVFEQGTEVPLGQLNPPGQERSEFDFSLINECWWPRFGLRAGQAGALCPFLLSLPSPHDGHRAGHGGKF